MQRRVYFWRPWYPRGALLAVLRRAGQGGTAIVDVERELERRLGARHVLLMPSGTTAIYAALTALTSEGRGQVILPSFVCDTVPAAVRAAGKTPRFLDVSLQTFNIVADAVARRVSPETQAIIAVHQSGTPCDIAPIAQIARERHLLLIEDAAQALGAQYRGRQAGTLGDVGILSFNNKVIDACGGGALVTDNDDAFQRLLQFRQEYLVLTRKGFPMLWMRAWLASRHPWAGTCGPRIGQAAPPSVPRREMNVITPLLLQELLPALDEIVRRRQHNFDLYQSLLRPPQIQKPAVLRGTRPSGCFYTVRLSGGPVGRDDVLRRLRAKGVQADVVTESSHRPFAPHLKLPASDNLSQTGLSFPTDPHLGEKDIRHVVGTLEALV
ncbi:MAG: DegT/DnrJ/EryC1/StrS family aminotransferase [Chloroflexi bacterium]|nr:DegT/DnrJ/EryC1/StrS family aminotransferase [Chloroflexota bacterium]